ncbi:MAG TPA: DUF4157 domain-containing protein [Pyrinomonadaceae bacterium]|jgi:hypothetical protein|nr:DUF4157 domain-containing protein [Pyrinomonadaceae bacterium]
MRELLQKPALKSAVAADISHSKSSRSSQFDLGAALTRSACACGGGCPACVNKNNTFPVQRKSLTISHPADTDEREADEIARKIADGQSAEVRGRADGTVSRKSNDLAEITPKFRSGLESIGGGSALDDPIRREMESEMGADFSGVRIHTGSDAHSMNEDINAQAFTHGHDIFFRQGEFDTGSRQGKELLAHELAHTVQQGKSRRLEETNPDSSTPRIQRQVFDPAKKKKKGSVPDAGKPNKRSSKSYITSVKNALEMIELYGPKLEALGAAILKNKEGIDILSDKLNAAVVADLVGSFNPLLLVVKEIANLIKGGSDIDYMISLQVIRANELEGMVKEYEEFYTTYHYAVTSLRGAMSASLLDMGNGVILEKVDASAPNISLAAVAVAGAAKGVHKNTKTAKGMYALYEIKIDGKIFKYGIANVSTLTASKIPIRLAQQYSKLVRTLGFEGAEITYKIKLVRETIKDVMISIESEKILKYAKRHGIPIGNVAHMKAWAQGLKRLSPEARALMLKFLKIPK